MPKRTYDDVSRSSSSKGPEAQQDEERRERHYMLKVGDEFDSHRYRVQRELGKGTFGRVIEMLDTQAGCTVAVKVVRAIKKYTHAAHVEAQIILAMQQTFPSSDFPIAKLLRCFDHGGHFCLVFEPMGPSLYHRLRDIRSYIESLGRHGMPYRQTSSYFSLSQIATIAHDCFVALAHLHKIRLTHTDLKPENILLVESPPHWRAPPSRFNVVLIDFGGATWEHEHHSAVVCTRQYRPPEVTLELPWTHSIDLWSMGCILAELWTGSVLFSTHDEVEHLALMERLLGTLPGRMLRHARMMKPFIKNGALRWPSVAPSRDSQSFVRYQPRLREVIGGEGTEDYEAGFGPFLWTTELKDFYNLVLQLLEYFPENRLPASDCLTHPFLRSTAAACTSTQQGTGDRYSTCSSKDREGSKSSQDTRTA
ncbi:hypothetical protein AB1Y20_015419 [Prymnesium parvum]|uniref:Protein kinase domain-containing protein n=1 Tax=Prymnesium parvum TaxID=97485 RepID=A0AB34K0H4_PRYPA